MQKNISKVSLTQEVQKEGEMLCSYNLLRVHYNVQLKCVAGLGAATMCNGALTAARAALWRPLLSFSLRQLLQISLLSFSNSADLYNSLPLFGALNLILSLEIAPKSSLTRS